MNLDWLQDRLVYLTMAGSQAYGLANELSDVDLKGICVPPVDVEGHLFERFEQAENPEFVERMFDFLRNPNNPKIESTVFSLKKFMVLAANVNPNIIELLWTDMDDVQYCGDMGHWLRDNRDTFLSSKAKFTFSGYAHAQLAKIERHRKWIVQGELVEPKREDFGLLPITPPGVEEIFGYIKSKVEQWNLNQFPLDEMDRADLKETIWDLVYQLCNKSVSWDNWPDAYAAGVIQKMQAELNLKEEVVVLINAERQFHKAKNNYKSWLSWKKERNPARRELEVKCGYDSKHASHLVRLLRMGHEIMTSGDVIVRRPDREEILEIKNGGWSYEKVMEYSGEMQKKLDEAYAQMKKDKAEGKPTVIPWNVNFVKVNELYHELVGKYYAARA